MKGFLGWKYASFSVFEQTLPYIRSSPVRGLHCHRILPVLPPPSLSSVSQANPNSRYSLFPISPPIVILTLSNVKYLIYLSQDNSNHSMVYVGVRYTEYFWDR